MTIRSLLETLLERSPGSVHWLCGMRGVRRRGYAAQLDGLVRSYRGNHTQLFADLRRVDLAALLKQPVTIDGVELHLPGVSRYAKQELAGFALVLFRDGVAPVGFVPVAQARASVPAERRGREAGEELDADYRSEAYRKELEAELAFAPNDAALPLRPYQERAVEKVLAALDPAQPKILHLATGGGKTRVANEIVTRWRAENGGTVLWVTKDWRLLKQAARDLSRRNRGQDLARLGGDGQALHPMRELDDALEGDVVYTTLQTLSRRLGPRIPRPMRPTLLVWDECHWGEHARAGKVLTACKRARVPVLGLTATPRERSRYAVAYSKTFRELVDDGFLARPEVEAPVETGVRWVPVFRGHFEDVTRASLEALALSPERNCRIVDHYAHHRDRYGKTIVFACSIEHVRRLVDLFKIRGIRARGIHSYQFDGGNRRALEEFARGEAQVLVNVEMLTHGIDVPDARTVFLCRPTTSDILFAQMIGRAARRDEASGKTSFHVVEFTDNVAEHGQLFESSQRYFAGSGFGEGSGRRTIPGVFPRVREHVFDPSGAPTWVPDDPDLPEAVRGLWYRQGQTFGIEFELTTLDGRVPRLDRAWRSAAEKLRRRLDRALPGRVAPQVLAGYEGSEGEKDTSVWNIEYDGSAGWEVTSRVLANREGLLEIDAACRALAEAASELGMRVNHRTGTHVHIGWLGRDLDEVKRAIAIARRFEPALATLVAPSRIARFENGRYDTSQPNRFCRPISTVFTERRLRRIGSLSEILRAAERAEARYVTLNLRPLFHLRTVEVRMHNGTLEARKILLWLSLWQQLLWAASHGPAVAPVPDTPVLRPDGDIVKLAVEHLPDAGTPQQRALLQRLAARRAELREEQWKRVPELAPWVRASEAWVEVA